jgi:hypothetical protein
VTRPLFRIVARDGVASAAELQTDYEASLARQRELDGASSTIDAFWFLVRLNDPDRLKAWLDRHSESEKAYLLSLLEKCET